MTDHSTARALVDFLRGHRIYCTAHDARFDQAADFIEALTRTPASTGEGATDKNVNGVCTPEMVEAGSAVCSNPDATKRAAEVRVIYLAMKAIDPEVESDRSHLRRMRAALSNIVAHYDARSELYTNGDDLAFALAELASNECCRTLSQTQSQAQEKE